MDDPLKPKPVPLAAETVLWFEFLLDPHKITHHLQRPHPGKRESLVESGRQLGIFMGSPHLQSPVPWS